MVRWLLIVGIAAGLAACGHEAPSLDQADPRAGDPYGYAERSMGEGAYVVTYRTPWLPTAHYGTRRAQDADAIRDLAHDMALWRGALIALETGHDSFDADPARVDLTAQIERYPGFINSLLLSPPEEPFDGRFGDPTFWDYHDFYRFPDLGRGVARMRGEAELEISLREDGAGAYDAASLAEEFDERYQRPPSPRSAAPPDPES